VNYSAGVKKTEVGISTIPLAETIGCRSTQIQKAHIHKKYVKQIKNKQSK